MSKPTPPIYRTTNWRSYNAALKQRWSLLIWFDPATVWLAEPSGTRGSSATFTDAAIQVCLTLKSLFGLPLRQATGLVASLLDLAGLDWPVPDFSRLCRRQKGLNVAIPYRQSNGALHLVIDSTGIKAEGDGEWRAKKHGPLKPRQWRKVHLGIDADTLEIRGIEVTGSRIGDAPMLPELLDQIPADQPIGKVSADGDYDTRASTPPSRRAAPLPSYRRGRTRGNGWRLRLAPRPGTKSFAPPVALAARSGGGGAGIIDEAWSRQKCGASNCWVSVSWRATSTGRWPTYRSGRRS
jgi:hypothetical protein